MSNLPQAGRSSHRLVRRFAALCAKATVPPTVTRFLASYPQASSRHRVDVMLIDIFRRWGNGQRMDVEEYLAADAEIAADIDLTLELITAEFDIRTRLNQQPTVDEYVERFESLADPIRSRLSQTDGTDCLPNYPEFVRQVVENGLTPATVWGGRLNNSTGFGSRLRNLKRGRLPAGSLLADCKPFSMLPTSVVRLIETSMEIRNFDVGESLIRQNTPGTELFVLCEGEVEISTSDDEGTRRVIARTSQTQVLGEMALLAQSPRNADVFALSPVRAYVLDAERFHELASRHPEISEVLTLLLAERLGTPDQDDVLAGKQLDEYRIDRRLGRGGMAVVYEAHHVDSGKRVALKMMSHRLVYEQEALDQFQAEADIIQSFDHDNIVRLYGQFSAFHTYFMVMEFVDGVSLQERIDESGPIPLEEFQVIFRQIVDAMSYAHENGVIHRDIKPANIMLTSEGTVKLMDFGLATPSLTSPATYGKVIGTPRYMAPEQLVGSSLTTAADLFALGCVGFEMLTGEPLNVEENVIELLRLHSVWQVPEIRQDFPHLDRDVCRVIEECLHEHPGDRRLDVDVIAKWSQPNGLAGDNV